MNNPAIDAKIEGIQWALVGMPVNGYTHEKLQKDLNDIRRLVNPTPVKDDLELPTWLDNEEFDTIQTILESPTPTNDLMLTQQNDLLKRQGKNLVMLYEHMRAKILQLETSLLHIYHNIPVYIMFEEKTNE